MIAIPSVVVPKTAASYGPGYIYWAPLGTSLPTNTVVGSVFTDNWPVGWVPIGITREGHTFSYQLSTEEVEAAEYFDPIANVTTGRVITMSFDLMQFHLTNVKRALNGGTLSTSGAGTTLLTTYTPPAPGGEVRSMLGWESTAFDERIVGEQVFQTGNVEISRRKGAQNASMPLEWKFEPNAAGNPYTHWAAGTTRG